MNSDNSSIRNPQSAICNRQVAVIGAGSWGTALALVAARAGNRVQLWAHEPEVAASINRERRNALYLSEITLPENIEATNDLAEALSDAEIVLSVIPSHVSREMFTRMLPHLKSQMILVSATKGIEMAAEGRPQMLAGLGGAIALIVFKHTDNIRRLRAGTENKFGAAH